jgi:hypothetical protein
MSWLSSSARTGLPNRRVFRLHVEALEDRQMPSTLTVVNTADHGVDSLRWAIERANEHAGQDTIAFKISKGFGPIPTIDLTSPLPSISDSVILDGSTQPGGHRVELNGASAGAHANGLFVVASSCTLRGLVINRFDGNGIVLDRLAGDNRVEGNYIGVDKTGMSVRPNHGDGIVIHCGDNTIGGLAPAARNVIAGNYRGIAISGNANHNTVLGNYIGAAADGVTRLANAWAGITIHSARNVIGSSEAGGRNIIISDNGTTVRGNGIEISSRDPAVDADRVWDVQFNVIQGNYIGVDMNGTDTVNAPVIGEYDNPQPTWRLYGTGIKLEGVTKSVIGGTALGTGNVISSYANGIFVTEWESSRDVIRSTGNVIQGNKIGTNADGTSGVGNCYGIKFNGGSENWIGGTVPGAGNIIAHCWRAIWAGDTTNAILGNSIYEIEYEWPAMYFGTGHQFPPGLTSVSQTSDSVTVQGTVSGAAGETYILEFFVSPKKGEGLVLLGRETITVTADGPSSFSFAFQATVAQGQYLTATATSGQGYTSGFSESLQVS